MKGNGYLRQVEFRRWSAGVDDTLRHLDQKVTEHGELLAVVKDRQQLGDERKKENTSFRYQIVAAIIATVFSVLVSLLVHLAMHGATG